MSAVDYTKVLPPDAPQIARVFIDLRGRHCLPHIVMDCMGTLSWRRGWDSNPHTLSDYYRFSKPEPYQLGLPLHYVVWLIYYIYRHSAVTANQSAKIIFQRFHETHCVKVKV